MDVVRAMTALMVALIVASAGVGPASAEPDEPGDLVGKPRPTLQQRFAVKDGSFYGHLTGAMHIRNDLYNSNGVGADLGYYLRESTALELRVLLLRTRLSDAAHDIKNRTGLTPDARAQFLWATAGVRYSFGYGKVLTMDRFVVHFDPQLVVHGGIATAEGRILPTFAAGLALLNHMRWGVQIKLDLSLVSQFEDRDRGWVPTLSFAPILGIGWSGGADKKGGM